MKAVILRDYGGPDVLSYAEQPDPVAGPGDVLVRVAAAGVNPVDTLERAGVTRAWRPLQFPAVLGWDVAGTITALGADVQGFSVGDQVMAWAYHGYAELCVVEATLLAHVPRGLDLVEAAALPLVTLTGSQLITEASGVEPGDTVLVSGAVGSVGRAAVFTAKRRGAHVIAGVQARQMEEALGIGADQVIALDDEPALGRLAPVDIVANTVRGPTAERLLSVVRDGGTFASVTGAPESAGQRPSVRVVAFVSQQDAAALATLAEAVRADELRIQVGRRMPLRDAREAHVAIEKGGVGGKILLIP